ncbi:MAG: elongation factor P maturation arginine rhamnosyltransferase EarP [Betaproteobacteria bacterium]|nr:elongation factor P maturation arginine rhamnosyltransferase EarP [Betaproteobacteria bacterium]
MARWDIFCTVIDNYGDAAVSWRLARQLTTEHGKSVRLWLDDLRPLSALCPQVNAALSRQTVLGVDIHHWVKPAYDGTTSPADVVIAAFGCRLSDSDLQAMSQQQPPPCWFNLEYLSAEPWVDSCHGLPSPHPQPPLKQQFFFPGFTPATGGLLREADLLTRRDTFQNDTGAQHAFWQRLACSPPPSAIKLSLFGYAHAPLIEVLNIWANFPVPIWCAVPLSPLSALLHAQFGEPPWHVGAVTLHPLPFLSQTDYDYLLWACDANFVRGEDSLVRAIWAGRPLVWHIYPQEEAAHHLKLTALLQQMNAVTSPEISAITLEFWHHWNKIENTPHAASRWLENLARIKIAQQHWTQHLSQHNDLALNMVNWASFG